MEIKKIEVYKFDELSDDAKLKALSEHNENNDYPFLEESLKDYLSQLLEENNIVSDDARLFYSLSYSQGDGVCFVGNFDYKGVMFNIKHNGHYYHSNSVDIEYDDDENDDLKNDLIESIYLEFKEVYKDICDQIEKRGYNEIEYEESEEAFKETCEANEYTFRASGEMENF